MSLMFRIHDAMAPKFQASIWSYVASRRCLHLCQVGIFAMVLFGIYISTFYHAIDNDKMLPIQELFNETSYTDTAILVNTENSNIILQKQLTTQLYERPLLYNETITVTQPLKIGNLSTNCGLPEPCSEEEFAVHLYTGKDHKDEPRLCVDGKYILTKNVNDGGRGMNVVIIDSMMKIVTRVVHFDTYEKESTPLELLLLTLRPGDIAILLTFDEPSRKLSRIAKLLLFDLGSALVQDLNYRGSWYLITQKGLNGFSPYEGLHFAESSGWPKHHDVRLCVPFKIPGQIVHPDPPVNSNPERVRFCKNQGDLPYFCDVDVVNDPLSPSPVWKQPIAINKIYETPIVVMSGKRADFLPLTLETLVRQPGIKPSLVAVYHLPDYKMVQELTDLFGFMSEEMFESKNYCEHVVESFERTRLLFPEAKEILFIGENSVLAPDFMYYMGQLLSMLKMDPSIIAVSALNENGYKTLSGDPGVVYRTQSFNGAAILVRKNFSKHFRCNKNSLTDPMYISLNIVGDVIVPDISRATLAAPSSFANSDEDVSSVYLSHDRTVTYEQNIAIKYPEKLFVEDYEKDLEMLILTAAPLEFDSHSLLLCIKDHEKFKERLYEELPLFISNTTNLSSQVLAVYFYQESERDASAVQYITQCLGLFYHPSYPVRGMYKSVLRFMLHDNQALLVGSKSPFFHLKSEQVPVLKYDHHRHRLISTLL